MSPRNTPLRPIAPLERFSEVRPITGRMLPVISHLSFVHPDLVQTIFDEVKKARRQVEGALTNDNGQGLLFDQGEKMEEEEEVMVPERHVDEILKVAQSNLLGRGIRLEKAGDSIRIVASENDDDDPYHGSGY